MKKLAIVTGGGIGIGRAIVEHLAAADYYVAIMEKNREAAEEVSRGVAERGGQAGVFTGDLIDHEDAGRLVAKIIAEHGVPWLLVNNIGGDKMAPFLQTAPSDWQSTIQRNLVTSLNMHHLILPHMIKAKGGRVVNISSDSARFGVPNVAVYAGCKGAIIAFTKCMAKEMAPYDILLNTLCPGATDTPTTRAVMGQGDGTAWVDAIVKQVPLGRIAVSDDYAPMVVFLAGPGAGYITGQTFSINGGKSMV